MAKATGGAGWNAISAATSRPLITSRRKRSVLRSGSSVLRIGLLTLLAWVARSADAAPPVWPDTPLVRRMLQAQLQTLNAQLLSHDSATLTLEHWCGSHHWADPPTVIALRVQGVDKPVSDEQRQLLHVGMQEIVRYRRVQLTCGGVVLSVADNWYVPGRLTPQMNAQLDGSDTPFGKVVSSLHFQRHTLSATLLWQPWPEGPEGPEGPARSDSRQQAPPDAVLPLKVPDAVLEHRAVLTLTDGTPFSEVIETYAGNVLQRTPTAIP
jgi:chorismate-pyruvate lyase